MVSHLKLMANCANARASTGPRTKRGKARSARNAQRHGLAVPIWADIRVAAAAEILAKEIAGRNASDELMAGARRIAEAQIDLMRVRDVARELIGPSLTDRAYMPMKNPGARLPSASVLLLLHGRARPEKLAYALADLRPMLKTIDRYERRARSRRKIAIRDFDIAKAAAMVGNN